MLFKTQFITFSFTIFPGVRRFPQGISKIKQATEFEDVVRQVIIIDYFLLKGQSELNWIITADILLAELLTQVMAKKINFKFFKFRKKTFTEMEIANFSTKVNGFLDILQNYSAYNIKVE